MEKLRSRTAGSVCVGTAVLACPAARSPANAPSSERLQKGYGSWAMACVSASLLDEDGVYRSRSDHQFVVARRS